LERRNATHRTLLFLVSLYGSLSEVAEFLVRAYAALALRYGILLNRRCPECGLPPHGPGRIVTVEGDPDHDPQERCSECGRFLWTTILIVYEDSEGSDAASTAEGGGVIAGA
jgi:hypothetical protein